MLYNALCIDRHSSNRNNKFKTAFSIRLKDLNLKNEVLQIDAQSTDELPDEDSICVVLYFSESSDDENEVLTECIRRGFTILPVYSKPNNFAKEVPKVLEKLHGFAWGNSSQPAKELVHEVLENLRITEKDRRVFLSYRRTDGYGIADQLFDGLNRKSFFVYKDDYINRVGNEFQNELYQYMDNIGFLLYVETKEAKQSIWVKKEIDRALANNLGIAVIRFPDVNADVRLKPMPTFSLQKQDLMSAKHVNGQTYKVLNKKALQEVTQFVMTTHAERVLARKRYFEDSIRDALELNQEDYHLGRDGLYRTKYNQIIRIDVRTPNPSSFHILQQIIQQKSEPHEGVIVHGAVDIANEDYTLNEWVIKDKPLKWKHLDDFIAEL